MVSKERKLLSENPWENCKTGKEQRNLILSMVRFWVQCSRKGWNIFLDKRAIIPENKGRRKMRVGRERTDQRRGQAELGRHERLGETSSSERFEIDTVKTEFRDEKDKNVVSRPR